MKSLRKEIEKKIKLHTNILNHWIRKAEESKNENPIKTGYYLIRIECYQSFIKDLEYLLKKAINSATTYKN